MNDIAVKLTSEHPRWTVQFSFRCKDEHQHRIVSSLGLLASDVVRTYLSVLIPDAEVLEPPGTPVRTAAFPSRASARKFISTFGGKLVPAG
jgi:hypothetical protein